jgi:hypothetical protein
MRLTGNDAIDLAGEHGLTLCKFTDPTEEAREGLTVAEAEAVVMEDPGLIYIDVEGALCESCEEGAIMRLATTKSRNPEFGGYALCAECAAEYDSRMEPEPAKPIIHEVVGHCYHGSYRINLRGPAEGFELSEAQCRKVWDTLCGMKGCTCGGSIAYGDGPDERTARVVREWVYVPGRGDIQEVLTLVPAGVEPEEGDLKTVIA